MMEFNDEYLISLFQEYQIPQKTINKLILRLAGCRVYIRAKKAEYLQIRELYKKLKTQHIPESEIINYISRVINKSKAVIRRVVRD